MLIVKGSLTCNVRSDDFRIASPGNAAGKGEFMPKAHCGEALPYAWSLDAVKVTEAAAVAAARLRGYGDEVSADRAAIRAMQQELNALAIDGRIVIGDGESEDADSLFIGKAVGKGEGIKADVAVDPLEGTTICAKALPNALSVMVIAREGCLLRVPDIYMNKIAVGPGYPEGIVDLDASVADNLNAVASAKGVPVGKITACVLDRPRHAQLIADIRQVGAAVRLIGDGDISGVIETTEPEETGIDIYMGLGGAPEGVLAAAALRCTGGQMQTRLAFLNDDHRILARAVGITDFDRTYSVEDLASGDVIFSATGITTGSLLEGVHFSGQFTETHSVVMHASSGTVRWISTQHHGADQAG